VTAISGKNSLKNEYDLQWRAMDMTHHIDTLNAAQQQAVIAPFGNLLILAGAGSGKTRVLVHRIAWFICEQSVSSHSILAVTFTNKAAAEMRGRLERMVGRDATGMWVGTFHGLSHKLLRLHWKEANLPQAFQVIDSDDQLSIIRRIFKALNINEERWEPKKAQGFINRKKDEGIRSHQIAMLDGAYEEVMRDVYREYEKNCEANGLVDFAELLLRAFEMIKNNAELREHYQNRFAHFLVDEFQDTNTIQYQWLCLLAGKACSVTVVGDDDQSIYGWRGAKIENIRRFEREFKGTELVRLEQNYRSTATILSAANALISNNGSRLGKTLWTQGDQGEPIIIYGGFNEEDEALFAVRQIRGWIEKGGRFNEIGILYRSNAQSRVLEEALVRAGISYTIYGGLRFFERAEIKDALAYLRLAINPDDNTAFERVVNVPPRGIGDKTFEKIKEIARFEGCSYWMATQSALTHRIISGKIGNGLVSFVQIVERLISFKEDPLTKIVESAIRDSGLLQFYREQKGEKAQSRGENLEELLNATGDFEIEHLDEGISQLSAFLSYTSLEGGERQSSEGEDAVQLMTLHSAKGLEFPMVFICGLEDGLFPHHFSRDNPSALEEERRLCYVGITRAMQQLFLTHAEKRRLFGRDEERRKSRFIDEIPQSLIKEMSRKVAVNRSSNFASSFGSRTYSPTQSHSKPQASSSMSASTRRIVEPESDSGFCLGQRISHPKFGSGTIVDHEGSGDRARVHVHFDNYGSKWLAIAYAKLEPM
jgi:DNA helicase-2/ATP-dependent DNA helicase PcrA